jgi:hypothetical protein
MTVRDVTRASTVIGEPAIVEKTIPEALPVRCLSLRLIWRVCGLGAYVKDHSSRIGRQIGIDEVDAGSGRGAARQEPGSRLMRLE